MTAWFILLAALAVGAYDLFQLLSGGETISACVRAWQASWPLLRWLMLAAFAFLWWHLFGK